MHSLITSAPYYNEGSNIWNQSYDSNTSPAPIGNAKPVSAASGSHIRTYADFWRVTRGSPHQVTPFRPSHHTGRTPTQLSLH